MDLYMRISADYFLSVENMNHVNTTDLAVIIMHTRDIRGGKGERRLFYQLMDTLVVSNVEVARALVHFVPEYGCWKDLWELYDNPALRQEIDSCVKEQFELDQESESPSRLVKWLPREGGAKDTLAKHFAALLFPLAKHDQRRTYRRTCAFLNRKIDTTEIKMCAKSWSTIHPENVPARLLKRCKKAFLNSGSDDRNKCAENFQRYREFPIRYTVITDINHPRYDKVREGLKNI